MIDKRIEEVVNNEWLKLGDTSQIETANPFYKFSKFEQKNFHIGVLNLMRNPDYFGFTCKHLLNKTLPPFQLAILHELWHREYPMFIASRGAGKSFLLGVYALLRAIFTPGVKIVITGAAFRQSKIIFEYAEDIWNNAPLLRDLCSGTKSGPRRDVDRCYLRIGESLITALPIGNGDKIRGQRASVILCDEFSSVNEEIFENVISGFASVSMSPIEKLKAAASRKAKKRIGLDVNENQKILTMPGLSANQTVLAGTAYYSFNHFYKYWCKWKSIIESKGDKKKLEEIFGGEIDPNLDWRSFSIIRMPSKCLPEGFMDASHLAKARATIHLSQYLMEYSAVFGLDSNGFFKRSLIESCVVGNEDNPIELASCGLAHFSAALKGDPSKKYVIAVDPASERDNFAIIVLELWPDHRRIVYCWTTTRKRFRAKLRKKLIEEDDFYGYVARKIRELIKLFPTEHIAIDAGGGGIAVMEALASSANMQPGERPIYPLIEKDNPKDTDDYPGDHWLEMVQFSRSEYVSAANHGMKKDLEDKALLFPEFDSALLGVAIEEDKLRKNVGSRLSDNLEDTILEIEELKDELATIVHSATPSGREHWDTPEIRQPGNKKGRLRKDRYSALLMANMAARTIMRKPDDKRPEITGGFVQDLINSGAKIDDVIHAPHWYIEQMKQNGFGQYYGAVARKGGV